MQNKSTILEELPKSSPKELRAIKNRIEFLLGHNKCDDKQSSGDQGLFYDIITKQLQISSGVISPPFYIFQRGKHFKKLKEAYKFIEEYLETLIKSPTKREKVQFYILFTKIQLKYLQQYDLPREISTIINAYLKFPAQLDKQFPSYGESGLLSILFRKKLND